MELGRRRTAWEPGDFRGPTCATCHMSGIGELSTTHNVSERLYWNLWAKRSEVRNSDDVMSPLLGDGPEGRAKMKMVCSSCHTDLHTDNFSSRAIELCSFTTKPISTRQKRGVPNWLKRACSRRTRGRMNS